MVGRKNRKKLSFAKTPNFVHLMMCPSSSHLRSGKIDNPDFLCPTLEVASVCCTGVIGATGRTISRSLGAGRVRVGTPNLIMEIDPNFNQRIRSRSTLTFLLDPWKSSPTADWKLKMLKTNRGKENAQDSVGEKSTAAVVWPSLMSAEFGIYALCSSV